MCSATSRRQRWQLAVTTSSTTATCTFTANYTVPDVGLQPTTKKNIVTVHYHPAGFPNDITDTDDHTVTVVPKSQLTDTSFCPLPNNQFRLLYHLEVAPNIYRLQASQPRPVLLQRLLLRRAGLGLHDDLQVPYPFVTQEGAGEPIQVHDGTGLTSSGCYIPNPSLSGFTITTPAMTPTSSAGNQIITPEDYTHQEPGQLHHSYRQWQGPGDWHGLRDHPPRLRPEEDRQLEAARNLNAESG